MTTSRRKFLQTAGVGVAAAPLAAPALAQSTITWRMQTYAGAALAEHVVKPAIDRFNAIAGDRMQIELFYADQLVPTGELFRAMQRGTIDAIFNINDANSKLSSNLNPREVKPAAKPAPPRVRPAAS